MEVTRMTEKQQAAIMVEIYTDLQRIQKTEDRDKEFQSAPQGESKSRGVGNCNRKFNNRIKFKKLDLYVGRRTYIWQQLLSL